MKFKYFILSALLIFTLLSVSRTKGELVAYWPLDKIVEGKVLDSTGNGHDGTIVGNLELMEYANHKGLYFDGGVNYIDCGSDGFDKIDKQLSLSAWIRIKEFDKRTQTIVSKDDDMWQLHRGWEESLNSVYFNVKANNGETVRRGGVMGKTDVNDGNWHHVVGVYCGKNLSLYLDGELSDCVTIMEQELGKKKNNFTIGDNLLEGKVKEDAKYSISWHGDISQVAIFDSALTPSQVGLLYNTDPLTCQKYLRFSDVISREDIDLFKNIPQGLFDSYIACKQLVSERKYSQAIEALDKLIHENITSCQSLVSVAFRVKCKIYLQQDDIKNALETMQTLQKTYPELDLPEVTFLRAYCYMKKGDKTKAQTLLLQLISNHSESSYALKARVCLRRLEEK